MVTKKFTAYMALYFFFSVLCVLFIGALVSQAFGSVIEYGLKENPNLQSLPGIRKYYFPAGKILFPIFWSYYLLIGSGLRYFFLKILGEPVSSFSWTLALTFYSSIPLVFFCMIGSIVLDVSPYLPGRSNASIFLQLFFTLVLFLGGFFKEAKTFIYASKLIFSQNTGRAFLTWSLPPFLTIFIVFFSILFYTGVSV